MANYYRPPKRFWGHLELLERYQSAIMAVDRDGQSYVADSEGPIILKLRCACGYQWELKEDDFPGRKALRSCGRPECRYTLPEGTGTAKVGAAHSIYLSEADTEAVQAYAATISVSFSKAIAILVRLQLQNIPSVNPNTKS